jgi:tripartite-type tricarboxylate transporter receptor subunit TctC
MHSSARRLLPAVATAFATVALLALPVAAQEFPNKPVRLIVPYAAGTATDILARQLSSKAGAILGQPFVVENRAGANGALGANSVARSAPDGYTLVFAANQTHATNAVLVRNLPYDPIKSFSPIVRLASQPQVLVVHPSLGVKSVAELVKLAKTKPGSLNFASTGNGTGAHLGGEFFKTATDIDIVHVPYSSAQVFTELLSGNTGIMFYPYAPLKPHIDAGKLVPLATTGTARAPWLPQLPTMIESGLNNFVMSSWFAIYGPAGMAPAVVDKIAAAYRVVLEQPEERAQMAATGTVPTYGGPQELADFTVSEIERVRQVVARGKIAIE